ncbi:MAG: ABC transporter ATP-binding protein [Polyangiales bacterium]
MNFSPPAGSPFAGGNSAQTSRAAGLPFAGIPPELLAGVKKIEAREPAHEPARIDYRPDDFEREPFTLWRFLAAHRGGLLMSLFLVVIATAASQAGPRLLAWAIDHGILARKFEVLLWAFVAYLVAIVLSVITSYARIRYTGNLGQRLMYDLRLRVFSHLQRLSLDFYTEERAGRLMTRMTSDIEALANLFQDGLVDLMVQGLTLVVITVVLLMMNVELTLIMLGLVVPAMVGLTFWYTRASDAGYGVVRDRIADVLTDLSESLAGIRLVAAFNRRKHNAIHHRNVVGDHYQANLDMAKVGAIYTPASDVVGLVGQLAMLLVGGRMVLAHELTLGGLTAFVLYLSSFFAPIQQLVQLYSTYQSGQAAVRKLRELLGTRPSVEQRPDAHTLPPIEGKIELRNVRFGYSAETMVLDGVSLQVEPGEVLAIVGPTGAGKSTVAKLVTRFYDPQVGSVHVDGHDLRDVTLESLRSQLGVVPQEPFLFHGSIRDNVSFGRPDASEADVLDACQSVGLDEVVARLPQGLDSPCFERGASLSAGERQLIALARAMLARPRVLVLDEATSNVDMQSEARVERALDHVLGGRTAIVIAHRLATARRASRIAVIDRGKLIEIGTHDELLLAAGRYAEMYATWVRGAGEATQPAAE